VYKKTTPELLAMDINPPTDSSSRSPNTHDSSIQVQSLSDYCQFLGKLHTNLKAQVQVQSTIHPSNTMSPPTLVELLERNQAYAPSHAPFPTFAEIGASGKPGPQVLVVTCADPRCEPYQFLNIAPFEAIALRTVGGRVEPQLPGIIALETNINFKEIAIVHHTDCGATIFTTEKVSNVLKERAPGRESEIAEMKFGDFKDIAGSVREDLKIFRENPFVSKQLRENAHGFVFDIKTGEVTNAEA
jgi:carbonic anhydrase